MATPVLLVEDNDGDINIIRSFCAEAAPDLAFTVAMTGKECRAMLATHQSSPFAALIFDYTLPDTDALTLLEEVVAFEYPAPVIVITARNDVETAVNVMKAGATDYLVKSTDYWEYLPRAIEAAITRDRLMRENRQLQAALSAYTLQLEQAARQVQLERDRLQTVLDQLPEGVVIVQGKEGRTVAANRAAERLWGHAFVPEVTITDYPSYHFEYLDGTPYPAAQTTIDRALRTGQSIMGEQLVIVQPQGQRIPALVNAAPLLDAQDEVIGAVGVFQDISELKQLEYLKDEILSIASHELKNPLTAIVGYSALLLRSPLAQGDARAGRAVKIIHQQSHYMHTLVEQLLDLSRLELKRMLLQMQAFDLAALLHDLVEEQQARYPEHTFCVQTDPLPLCVTSDQQRITQVITSLMNHIVQCDQDKHNTISLTLTRHNEQPLSSVQWIAGAGPFALIRVHAPNANTVVWDQQQHFGASKSLHRTLPIATGQGLNLYISTEIVRLHGGALSIEDTPGVGSVYNVLLPIAGQRTDHTG